MDIKHQELSRAATAEEVVRVTREYLATWSAEELERLPDACRPGRVGGPEDIETWADRLTGEAAKAPLFLDDERKLDRLTSHFLIASVRLRQLARAPSVQVRSSLALSS